MYVPVVMQGEPRKHVITPPASFIITANGATSQIFAPKSTAASTRPLATRAKL